jgi:hypothetical protein
MSVPQIPRYALKNTASLYPYVSTSELGVVTYGTKIDLVYVQGQPVKKSSMTSLGEQKDDALLFFFDSINSLPAGQTFKELDKMIFNGQAYITREATPEPNIMTGGTHHWELRLISGGET